MQNQFTSVLDKSVNCLLSKYLIFSRICCVHIFEPKYKWGDLSGVSSITHASLFFRIGTRRSRHIRRLLQENGNTSWGMRLCRQRRLCSLSLARIFLPVRGDGGWEIATQLTMQDDSSDYSTLGEGFVFVWEKLVCASLTPFRLKSGTPDELESTLIASSLF